MADEVAMFSIEMGGDGAGDGSQPPGGAIPAPNFGESLGRITSLVASIEKIAGTIASTLGRIEAKFASGGVASRVAGDRPSGGAGFASSSVKMRNVSSIPRERSIVPFASQAGVHRPRPGANLAMGPGSANPYRNIGGMYDADVIDVEFEEVPPAGSKQPPKKEPGRSRVKPAPRPFPGFNASSLLSGLSYGNPFVIARAFGAAGLAIAAPIAAGALISHARASGLETIAELGQFSPSIATDSARIGIATLQKNLAIASNPLVQALSRAATNAEIRYQAQGGRNAAEARSVFSLGVGTFFTNFMNAVWTGQPFVLAAAQTGIDIGEAINEMRRNSRSNTGAQANAFFYDALNDMTQDMLHIQDEPHLTRDVIGLGAGSTNWNRRHLARNEWDRRYHR